MKTLVKLMSVVMGVIMASCSGDDFIMNTPPQTPDTNEKNDNNKNDDNDKWENVLDDWYEMINDYKTIDSYKKTNLKDSYNAQAPFSVSLGDSMYFTTEDKNKSSFGKLHSIDPRNRSYGEWYSNAENDSLRSVTTTQLYECNLYNRNVTVTNAEAFRYVNGGRDPFVMPQVVVSFAGHSSKFEETEILRNDSIFSRENIKDSVKVAFGNRPDIKPFYVSAKTTIDHFIKMKENEETMPTPDVTVEGEITYISSRTASPIFISETSVNWYEICIVKTTQKTYVVANGAKVSEWSNDELENVNWHSAIYDAGYTNKWVPANISVDGTGWTYVLQFSNGEHRQQTVWMNNALISSLKSFSKDNNAAQTPYLNSAAAVKREFSNGTLYSVTGTYSFTVAAK